jgi:hypothetical protein
MANGYKGEKTITLYHVDYLMVINMEVIAEFQSETGKDFMAVGMQALNAFYKSRSEASALTRAEIMTKAVSLDDVAHLFYIAAKQSNSQVDFGEIQEAILFEGALENTDNVTYPLLFVSLIEFALVGVVDSVKKKNSENLKADNSKPLSVKKA